MTKQLNDRIITTLTDTAITAAEITTLIEDVEVALTRATTDAADIIRRAMDPLEILDPVQARTIIEIGNFQVVRLENALRYLTNKLGVVRTREARANSLFKGEDL
jgi:hypothetical protein